MKPYERRAQGAYPYYLLAVWNARLTCWKDGKRAFSSKNMAERSAKGAGKYRVSQVNEDGIRRDFKPFEIS